MNTPPWVSGGFPIKIGEIRKRLRNGRVAVYRYLLVPVRLDDSLRVGDRVELLLQAFGGFTVWIPGTIFGKFKVHYQIYVKKEADQVLDFIIKNNLPATVLAIRRISEVARGEEPRKFYTPVEAGDA
jgi:hypothetical protein